MVQAPAQNRGHNCERYRRGQRDPKGAAIPVTFGIEHVGCLACIRSEVALIHGTFTPVSRSSSASADSCSTNSLRYARSRFRTSRKPERRLSKTCQFDWEADKDG